MIVRFVGGPWHGQDRDVQQLPVRVAVTPLSLYTPDEEPSATIDIYEGLYEPLRGLMACRWSGLDSHRLIVISESYVRAEWYVRQEGFVTRRNQTHFVTGAHIDQVRGMRVHPMDTVIWESDPEPPLLYIVENWLRYQNVRPIYASDSHWEFRYQTVTQQIAGILEGEYSPDAFSMSFANMTEEAEKELAAWRGILDKDDDA